MQKPNSLYKKNIPIFLLLVICMPILISMVLLAMQQVTKYKMLEKLESEHLTTLVLKKNMAKWNANQNEININGQLFDVKKIEFTSDSIFITGLYDKEEANLINALHACKPFTTKAPFNHLIVKLLHCNLFFEQISHQSLILYCSTNNIYKTYQLNTLSHYPGQLNGPPPDML
jgi:hypothetical protein